MNSSRGGGSKDTWVLAGTGSTQRREHIETAHLAPPQSTGPAMADLTSQVEQQQQSRTEEPPC